MNSDVTKSLQKWTDDPKYSKILTNLKIKRKSRHSKHLQSKHGVKLVVNPDDTFNNTRLSPIRIPRSKVNLDPEAPRKRYPKCTSLLRKIKKKNKAIELIQFMPQKPTNSQYQSNFDYDPNLEWVDMKPDRFHFRLRDDFTEFREILILSKNMRANKK